MQKTLRNQEPAYAEPYDEVVAAVYEAYPPFPLYDRKYDKYDMYYKILRGRLHVATASLWNRLENFNNV